MARTRSARKSAAPFKTPTSSRGSAGFGWSRVMAAPNSPTLRTICASVSSTSIPSASAMIPISALLPLYRRRRLAADVVDHPIDAGNLIDDAAADLLQHLVRDVRPFRRHRVLARHRAQN